MLLLYKLVLSLSLSESLSIHVVHESGRRHLQCCAKPAATNLSRGLSKHTSAVPSIRCFSCLTASMRCNKAPNPSQQHPVNITQDSATANVTNPQCGVPVSRLLQEFSAHEDTRQVRWRWRKCLHCRREMGQLSGRALSNFGKLPIAPKRSVTLSCSQRRKVSRMFYLGFWTLIHLDGLICALMLFVPSHLLLSLHPMTPFLGPDPYRLSSVPRSNSQADPAPTNGFLCNTWRKWQNAWRQH